MGDKEGNNWNYSEEDNERDIEGLRQKRPSKYPLQKEGADHPCALEEDKAAPIQKEGQQRDCEDDMKSCVEAAAHAFEKEVIAKQRTPKPDTKEVVEVIVGTQSKCPCVIAQQKTH